MDSTTAVTASQEIASKVIESISENTQIGTTHILLVILGALLFNLMELDRIRRQKKKFSIKIWIHQNWLPVIISTTSLVIMFLLREGLQSIMGFDMTNRLGCFLAGFTVHTFTSKSSSVAGFSQEKQVAKLPDLPSSGGNEPTV